MSKNIRKLEEKNEELIYRIGGESIYDKYICIILSEGFCLC